jgi:hypothetical protein
MTNLDRNFGLIIPKPKPSDYVAGALTGITYQEVNPTGQWDNYLPLVEQQGGKYMDAMACVSFSATNALETQLKQKGIDTNFSDRFVAKMSGTTHAGNSLETVADAIRHYGLVDETLWPYDRDTFDWDKYYESIPSEVTTKGADWLRTYEVQYEWVSCEKGSLMKHLKQAPLQITVKTCPPWNTNDVILNCGTLQSNHAILLTGYVENEYWKIFDSYDPNNKKLEWNYYIPWALKYVVNKKANPILVKYEGKYLFRAQGQGQIYKVVGGQLIYLSPEKVDGHTPLFDDWLTKLNSLGLLVGITEDFYINL